ncbi:adenosine deaminase [Capronia coronata CBS 617.96]|uniref:Adenosine deaminase n=1 Tax=Capronia coronata CBS 617.96 TaxID=1182541 RepID=W9XK20_9EURO|nr:adenosine deaminase [Capronia coronata CBS 617.96]EXJ80553.1 adenosine deaminase [Capronia coronata CBS 617.96]
MGSYEDHTPMDERKRIRDELLASEYYPFVVALPKVELHLHIEGTLVPELRWEFAQRNGLTLKSPRTGQVYRDLEHLRSEVETFSFFEAYYDGFDVLHTTQDYYDLAMNYFRRASAMNVRYVEVFFDPQGHTRRGVGWDTFMTGFQQASERAEKELNVKSKWIMCILRDMSPESAMEHYEAALNYRDMIVGLGLDSESYKLPPSLFENVWSRARADGFFKLTAHCDDGAKEDVHDHIREACCSMGGTGADRIDHGINTADVPELIELVKSRNLGLTLCPCAYLRHQPAEPMYAKIRLLYDQGVKIMIGSDDPAYMDDNWQVNNMLLVQSRCGFSDHDMVKLAKNAVDMSWAPEPVKEAIVEEIDSVFQNRTTKL